MMNAFVGRARVACEPSVAIDGSISTHNLLLVLNSLSLNPNSSLQEGDLLAIYRVMNVAALGDEKRVNCEDFLKKSSALFASTHSEQDSEDVSPFDQLVAYRELFERIDTDKDGRLYSDQLHELVRGLNRIESTGISRSPDTASTDMIVAHLDRGQKGYVDFVDFLLGALKAGDSSSEEHTSTTLSSNNIQAQEEDDDDDMFKTAYDPDSSRDSVFVPHGDMTYSNPAMSPAHVESQLHQALAKENAAVQQIKAKVHQLEQKLSVVQSELTKSESSRAELIQRLTEQDKHLDTYKKQAKATAELETEKNRLADDIEQLKAQLVSQKDLLKQQQKKESDLIAERDQLRDDLFQRRKEINDVEDQLRTLRDAASDSTQEKDLVSKLQAELLAQSERLEGLLKEKLHRDQEHASLVQALQALQTKHEETLLEMDDTRKKLSEAQDEKLALASPMRPKGGNLKAELSSSLRNKSLPSTGTTPLSELFDSAATTSSVSIPTGENNLQEVVNQLKVELDMLEKEKRELLAHLSTAGARTTQLEKDKAELTGKVTTLSGELGQAEKARAALARQLEDMQAELDEAKGMLKAAQDAVTAANAAAAKAAANAYTRPEASITENELDELRALRANRRELEEQLAKFRTQIDADVVQLKAMRNEVQQLREMNRSLKNRLSQVPEDMGVASNEEDLRRGLIGNSRVSRHDPGCCAACTIM